MNHFQNLANYTKRRAEAARAAGDTERAERLEAAAAHWEKEAAR